MDVWTLDENFRMEDMVENFSAIVWTDRYSAEGDFVLHVPDTPAERARFPHGRFLSISESREVMIVETRQAKGGLLEVRGKSLVGFLKHRMLRDTWYGGNKAWIATGVPGAVAANFVFEMCCAGGAMEGGYVVDAAIGARDVIPNLVIGSTAAGVSEEINIEWGQVYDGVKTLCDAYDLGFALYPSYVSNDTYVLTFTTYAGADRTSTQSVNPTVRFEPALDSLTDTTELSSIEGYRNVAYAWATNMTGQFAVHGVAYAPGGSLATAWNRRALYVAVTDIDLESTADSTGAKLRTALNLRAKTALANNNYVRMVDGQIVPQTGFKYGLDYFLGDIIELRVPSGLSDRARITEYIHTQDKSGYKAYPTLSVQD